MIIAYFIVAGLAAVILLIVGSIELLRSKPALNEMGMAWVEEFSPGTIRLIGVAQVLGAIGLIVPMSTGIAPILSPIAGVCLGIIMIGAASVHVRRKEPLVPQLVLAALPIAAAVLGFLVVAS